MAFVRISLGRFDPENFETVRKLLDESQRSLVPAIRALKGNHSYYVGIDQQNSAMTNVSVWETLEDAQQMASLQAMLDLAGVFVKAGVRFERPITNHKTLWTI
jgi:quinol monooxygenase YgiN